MAAEASSFINQTEFAAGWATDLDSDTRKAGGTAAAPLHVAANDNAALYLSYSQDPANKRLLASEPESNGYREWQAGSNQASRGNPPANISSPVYLEAGRYYWVEAHAKEGMGDDHLGVTWQGPGDPAPVNGGPAIQGAFLAMPLP